MRKIVASTFLSLDGVMESPDKWHLPFWSDELGEVVGAAMAGSDAMLLGRVTYQEFAGAWSSREMADDPGADHMNNTPKYVVSTTLDTVEWRNSTLLKGDLVEEITKLKQQPGKNISISGSAMLIQSLMRDQLIDEFQLLVHPVVVGHGKRLFADGMQQQTLRLVESKTIANGVLALTYQPAT
jgi:dihydrofolate reductase